VSYIYDVGLVGGPILLNDNVTSTGEINGQDGVTESVQLCKRDAGGNLVGCQMAGSTGVLSDGTTIEFTPGNIEVKLAVTNGYAHEIVTVNYSCHG
jgi:hypothetical protein